jgi:anaerobic selenocysteine-containing dehydrogenase
VATLITTARLRLDSKAARPLANPIDDEVSVSTFLHAHGRSCGTLSPCGSDAALVRLSRHFGLRRSRGWTRSGVALNFEYIIGDKDNPDSQGFLCVRGRSTNEIFGNPRRLYPHIRDDRRTNTWRRANGMRRWVSS